MLKDFASLRHCNLLHPRAPVSVSISSSIPPLVNLAKSPSRHTVRPCRRLHTNSALFVPKSPRRQGRANPLTLCKSTHCLAVFPLPLRSSNSSKNGIPLSFQYCLLFSVDFHFVIHSDGRSASSISQQLEKVSSFHSTLIDDAVETFYSKCKSVPSSVEPQEPLSVHFFLRADLFLPELSCLSMFG